LPSRWPYSGDFLTDPSGKPHLYFTDERRIVVYGDDRELATTFEPGRDCEGLLTLPAESACFVTRAADEPRRDRDYLCAFDASFEPVWTFRPEPPGIRAMEPLRTEAGVAGVVVTTKSELVALDPTGAVLWRCALHDPPWRLYSHPALPGVLYTLFPEMQRYEVTAASVTPVGEAIPLDRCLRHRTGVLFPDERGRPSLIVAAEWRGVGTVVRRLDEGGTSPWTVTLPAALGDLAMLEVPGKPRVFVVTVESGELHVLDERGALLQVASFPVERDDDDRRITYRLAAGELYAGEWAVYLRTTEGGYLYRVDPAKL